jgi:hypothetical protein
MPAATTRSAGVWQDTRPGGQPAPDHAVSWGPRIICVKPSPARPVPHGGRGSADGITPLAHDAAVAAHRDDGCPGLPKPGSEERRARGVRRPGQQRSAHRRPWLLLRSGSNRFTHETRFFRATPEARRAHPAGKPFTSPDHANSAHEPPIWRLLRRLCVAIDAEPEWRLCRVGSAYRSVVSQAGTPIEDATMRTIVAGWPSGSAASRSPRGWAIPPPEPADGEGVPWLNFER